MSTQEHEKNVAALFNFLLLPAELGLTEPPPIPLNLDGLPAAVYLDAALHYIEQYPFDRDPYKYTPKTRERYSYTADSEWKEKARTYLQACIKDYSIEKPRFQGKPHLFGHPLEIAIEEPL
jgi:hypothetical protein